MPSDQEKLNAARAAVALVQSGMLVGLGSGSTAACAIRLLGERVRDENLNITGVPTSAETRRMAIAAGIPLLDPLDGFCLDIAIDGADEITRSGDAIKGGGGAMLHERIVASAAREFIVICDASKLVPQLGEFPLPVEVIQLGWRNVQQQLKTLGCDPRPRLDKAQQPIITEEGNLILDCHFPPGGFGDPRTLDQRIRNIVGVVDHGLFLGMTRRIFIGRGDQVEQVVIG